MTPLLTYDERALVGALGQLSPMAQSLFAAACAERLVPVYRWFHERTGRGHPAVLEAALDRLWADLGGDRADDLEQCAQSAEELVPYEDDMWVDECAFAQHAAAVVAYSIRARLTGDSQEAAWAARQVYEALDYRVTTRDDLDLNAPNAELGIMSDPLVQAELGRQRRDLEQLRMAQEDPARLVGPMRDRARSEASVVLDLDSP